MSLPHTGEVEIVAPREAAEIVEDVAEDHGAERLLIVLDVDGTVILEDETLSPGVVEAVEDAGLAGHEVMIATGRSWAGTEDMLRALNIEPEYVVCSNGAVVMKRDGVEYVRAHTETFDPTQVLTLLRVHLPHARYMVELADGERLYTDIIDDWNLERARKVTFDALIGTPVSRVVVVSPGHDEEDFSRLVEDIGLNHVSYAIGWTAWLDIAPQGVDKGTALELVRGWLGFDPAHVLVIGDGRNDLGMFAWARRNGGRAIAMAQGPQEVRDAASHITTSVQEGGVAAALRRLRAGGR
ncbi:MAG TPA: HAD family hydrolase [Microbacterium sp.]|uniref:HAD family hydrolase n=1 Tax=Microbacterium sp. TaxID=51671 RepID=UPI002CEE471A|nr:HAD family hydrolase [Microbacterium sp.]HWI29854.1 HAD family hydrolase [Microbacterium sp.]